MNGKQILNIEKPATQAVKAVCSLLAWKGRSSNPLPEFVEMGEGEARLVLVLSNKRDAYYVTTPKACSCPAAVYHHGPCKHMRKYFAEQTTHKQTMAETLAQADENLHKMPYQYQKAVKAARDTAESEPLELAPKGPFKPVCPDECDAAPSTPLYIDMHDTSPAEVAYFERKEAVEFLPCEA